MNPDFDDPPIRGIVLDAVGTIIEPRPSVSEAYAQAAMRQGCAIDVDVLKTRFRDAFAIDEIDEQRGALATNEETEFRRWKHIVEKCLPQVPDPGRAFEELWAHFADPSSWIVFPDVLETVQTLKARGFHICVASNFDGRLRRVAAGLEDLRNWIEPLVISSEVGYRKPHPAFYRAACERLDLDPKHVLCVGDDLANDVEGPRRAGIRSILIDRRGSESSQIPSLRDLNALVDLLGKTSLRD